MKLRLDWLHVQLEERPASTVIIPDSAKDALDLEAAVFDVINIGPDVVDCQVGDKVIASGMATSMGRFKYQNENYFVVREADVVCIMNRN